MPGAAFPYIDAVPAAWGVRPVLEKSRMSDITALAPEYTLTERSADRVVHIVGVIAAMLAVPVLITLTGAANGDGDLIAAVSVYGATLIAMLSISAAYNMTERPRAKEILRRLDHGVIYLKIAGTYTPFAVVVGGAVGVWLLAGVWAVAALGFALKLFLPRRFELFALLLYLALGWTVMFLGSEVFPALTTATIVLIAVGGGLYTLGVLFHLWSRLPYQNAIWHGFVLAASFVFYAAVLVEVVV